MLTAEQVESRREIIAGSAELTALGSRLGQRVRRVVSARPTIVPWKGMLSADGGWCPSDGSPLQFDPLGRDGYRCHTCGTVARGERHDWWWAWHEHLWRAERIAEAAAVAALTEDESAGQWAAEQALTYAARYREYPNRDNVLGPSRLFFSTYLESIWLTSYLAGAYLLRESGLLQQEDCGAIDGLVDDAAGIIGEFDEGLSNRQTWNNAALAAAAIWFEDEALAQRAIEGPHGLVGHLADGFGADGLWYEGENYHLFALRGYLIGLDWARLAGADLLEEPSARGRLEAALLAPIRTVLPDGTFPARRDARFGISLAQPMYLESWERGLALVGAAGDTRAAGEIGVWLRERYAGAAPPAELFDSWLHEAGEAQPVSRARTDLSWWMLATMAPELPADGVPPSQDCVLLEEQGLAIFRSGGAYASLECGEHGGGHGHPDRLHLTLHAGGVHWLADPGTGSYVAPNLAWYRSTLAHDAPRLDGASQALDDAECEAFDVRGGWAWARGKFGGLSRTVIQGQEQLVDVVEFSAEEEHLVELPWHLDGTVEILSSGRWESEAFQAPFVSEAERFVPDAAGSVAWRATSSGASLHGVFDASSELIRAVGPARPGQAGRRPFLLRRARGRYVRFATVLSWSGSIEASFNGGELTVTGEAGVTRHRVTSEGWEVQAGPERVVLGGGRRRPVSARTLLSHRVGQELWKYTPPTAHVSHLIDPPALDGSLVGFPPDETLVLDHDDQYRRTEEPYPGPDVFSARARLGWDERCLYLAVEVTHDTPVFRSAAAPPLLLDNEPDFIHADGIQCHLQLGDSAPCRWLVTPDPASTRLQVHASEAAGPVRGAWRRTTGGYAVTLAFQPPGWPPAPVDEPPRFDLVVNEMRPGRLRRAGQLLWTGGGGWAYLRGDRADSARFGVLELL